MPSHGIERGGMVVGDDAEAPATRDGTRIPAALLYDGSSMHSGQAGDLAHWTDDDIAADIVNPDNIPIPLDPNNPKEWALRHHLPNLITEINAPSSNIVFGLLGKLYRALLGPRVQREPVDRRFRVNFAELQRMRIRKLQCSLVKDVVQMRSEQSEPPGWEARLKDYIEALKDYDFMDRSSQLLRDPFLATGEYAIDNYVLRRTLPPELLLRQPFRKVDSFRGWERSSATTPITGTRNENEHKSWVRRFQLRLATAALGGTFLIGPMWLMVLRDTVLTALVSTTVFVAVFGFGMAVSLSEMKDVLASTAAYAAVLVVFVGTNIANGQVASQ